MIASNGHDGPSKINVKCSWLDPKQVLPHRSLVEAASFPFNSLGIKCSTCCLVSFHVLHADGALGLGVKLIEGCGLCE